VTHQRISRGLVVLVVLFGASLAAWGADAPTVSISSPSAQSPVIGDSQEIAVSVAAAGGAKVAYLELYVDGSLHTAKRLSPPVESGKAALSWATSQFVNGEHAVEVIAHDTAGESAMTSVKLQLERPGGPEIALPTITITSPSEGGTVSGKTRVTMQASAPSGVRYVMLFIDEAFTCFTNMPPFEYLWNTARSANGEHVLQAKAFDAAEREGLSAKITVRVNNPGGRTTMETDPAPEPVATAPDPAPAPAAAAVEPPEPVETSGPSVSVAEPASAGTISSEYAQAAPANPQHEPVKIARLPASLAGAPADASAVRTVDAAPAPIVSGATRAAAAAPAVAPEASAGAPAEPAPSTAGPATNEAAGPVRIAKAPAMARREAIAAPVSTAVPAAMAGAAAAVARTPVAPAGASVSPEPVRIAKAPAMGRQQGAAAPVTTATPVVIAKAPSAVREIAVVERSPAGIVLHTVRPGQELGRIAATYGVPIETLATANSATSGRALSAGETLRVPVAKGELYLDGQRLASDTPTLFVSGIAAGPFRYIVEHSGGTITWSPADRSVAASGLGKDIRVWVGKAEAQVDGETLVLDVAVFIDHERTMVPLRFFRDALGYAVTYDEDSGRIHIARR